MTRKSGVREISGHQAVLLDEATAELLLSALQEERKAHAILCQVRGAVYRGRKVLSEQRWLAETNAAEARGRVVALMEVRRLFEMAADGRLVYRPGVF